jgi:hypothetical protein
MNCGVCGTAEHVRKVFIKTGYTWEDSMVSLRMTYRECPLCWECNKPIQFRPADIDAHRAILITTANRRTQTVLPEKS